MKKTFFVLLAVLFVIVLAGCVPSQPSGTPAINQSPVYNQNTNIPAANLNLNVPAQNLNVPPTNVPPINVPPNPNPVTKDVTIANFAFNPATLNIKAGDTVKWTNNDSVTHRIASDTFNSQDLNNGDSFSYKFSQAGTYNYHCGIHPFMTGSIIVSQ